MGTAHIDIPDFDEYKKEVLTEIRHRLRVLRRIRKHARPGTTAYKELTDDIVRRFQKTVVWWPLDD